MRTFLFTMLNIWKIPCFFAIQTNLSFKFLENTIILQIYQLKLRNIAKWFSKIFAKYSKLKQSFDCLNAFLYTQQLLQMVNAPFK